jgi:hypothetical protein
MRSIVSVVALLFLSALLGACGPPKLNAVKSPHVLDSQQTETASQQKANVTDNGPTFDLKKFETNLQQMTNDFEANKRQLTKALWDWGCMASKFALSVDDGKTDPKTIASSAVAYYPLQRMEAYNLYIKINLYWNLISGTPLNQTGPAAEAQLEKYEKGMIDQLSGAILLKRSSGNSQTLKSWCSQPN